MGWFSVALFFAIFECSVDFAGDGFPKAARCSYFGMKWFPVVGRKSAECVRDSGTWILLGVT